MSALKIFGNSWSPFGALCLVYDRIQKKSKSYWGSVEKRLCSNLKISLVENYKILKEVEFKKH